MDTLHSYTCGCFSGYQLAADEKTCKGMIIIIIIKHLNSCIYIYDNKKKLKYNYHT